MKYSKEKMIRYLEKRIETISELAGQFASKGDSATATRYIMERISLRNIIYMMTDNEFFEKQYRIYFKEEE